MMLPAFRTTRRVEFADTDMAGLVHFSNFFRYMEAAEVEFLRSLGLTVAWGPQQPLGFPRVSASCDFIKPARFGDLLDVRVNVHKVGRKSVTYGFSFFKDDELVARGQISAVCCRLGVGQKVESVEIPDHVRQKLEDGSGE